MNPLTILITQPDRCQPLASDGDGHEGVLPLGDETVLVEVEPLPHLLDLAVGLVLRAQPVLQLRLRQRACWQQRSASDDSVVESA